MSMKSIVVFASGSGTNAENIIRYYQGGDKARVSAVFCNNPEAGVIEKAENLNVPVVLFNKAQLLTPGFIEIQLTHYQTDLIVLAGFLWLFPARLVQLYPGKILNIHPALLPAYGGKGMYGDRVHQAVLENHEHEHGVTVHLVNEHYDEGNIVMQESFPIEASETLESVTKKIHLLEFSIYPKAISKILGI